MKNLHSIQQKVFENSTEFYQFSKIYLYILSAAFPISMIYEAKYGGGKGFDVFLFISGFGLIISILAFLGIKFVSSTAGSLHFHGSKEKDHKAILGGMYSKAEGQVLAFSLPDPYPFALQI